MSVACSIAQSAVAAGLLPASAFGSICERLAEITANSAPTKNALRASKTTSHTNPVQYSPIAHILAHLVDQPIVRGIERWIGVDVGREVLDLCDSRAVDLDDPQGSRFGYDLVADLKAALG